jgi:serine/threonine-protein kinase SRPK3
MMELLGRMPDTEAFRGQRRKRFFHHKGNFRRIAGLKYWPLIKVLTEKYRFREVEAA